MKDKLLAENLRILADSPFVERGRPLARRWWYLKYRLPEGEWRKFD